MHLTTVRQTVNWLSKSHPQSHSENREKKDFTNSLLSTTHGHSGQWEVRGNLLRDFWERYFLCLTCRRRKAWPCFLLSAFECGNRYLVTKRLTKTFTRTLGITKTPRYWQCPLTPRLLVNDVHQLKDIFFSPLKLGWVVRLLALFLLSLLTHECTRSLFLKAGPDKGNSRLFTVNKPRPTGRRIMSPGCLKHIELTPSSKMQKVAEWETATWMKISETKYLRH